MTRPANADMPASSGVGCSDLLGGILRSMVMACVNPHRLSLACALESALAVEIQRAAIRNQHVLMKSCVTRHEMAHQLGADATSLILWQHEQMRIVNYQMAVRDGVAESNKSAVIPCCEKGMRG